MISRQPTGIVREVIRGCKGRCRSGGPSTRRSSTEAHGIITKLQCGDRVAPGPDCENQGSCSMTRCQPVRFGMIQNDKNMANAPTRRHSSRELPGRRQSIRTIRTPRVWCRPPGTCRMPQAAENSGAIGAGSFLSLWTDRSRLPFGHRLGCPLESTQESGVFSYESFRKFGISVSLSSREHQWRSHCFIQTTKPRASTTSRIFTDRTDDNWLRHQWFGTPCDRPKRTDENVRDGGLKCARW